MELCFGETHCRTKRLTGLIYDNMIFLGQYFKENLNNRILGKL